MPNWLLTIDDAAILPPLTLTQSPTLPLKAKLPTASVVMTAGSVAGSVTGAAIAK